MANDLMVIFTAQSLEKCLKVGGTRSWVLDRANAKRCKYVILCRNAHTDWGDGKEPHHTAFMIGRISDVVPSTDKDCKGRWMVTFSEYAPLDIPKFWQGWRNPVHYTTFEKLGFSLDGVHFKPMPEVHEEIPKVAPAADTGFSGKLTIAEAKKALANTFGVEPEAIEIIIHG